MAITFPLTLNSQEEFDKMISERLTREAKKYEGFETFKAQAAELATLKAQDLPGQLEKYKKDLSEANEKLTKAQTDAKAKADADAASIADLTSKAAAAELGSLRIKTALDAGLSYELADRLKGATAEELKADAEKLAPLFAKPATQPLGGNDKPSKGNDIPRNPFNGKLTEEQAWNAYAQLSESLKPKT